MNDKLTEDNEKMKEAISQIEQKLAVMEKPQQLPNSSGQITRPTTTTGTTVKPTPPPENCKLKISYICYFAAIQGKYDIVYNKAVDICKKRNASVGLIRDEKSYNTIMNYLRKNIPEDIRDIWIWTGIKINPMTRDVTPLDSFTDWYPDDFPFTGIDNKNRTNVYLVVNSKPNPYPYQGMVNAPPTWGRSGVIYLLIRQKCINSPLDLETISAILTED
ncbi:uncharacterized protein LOC120345586 [Styela clava]